MKCAFFWSLRRELWENRSVYLAPAVAAAVYLFGFLVSMLTLPDRLRAAFALQGAPRHQAIVQPYLFGALLVMGAGVIVGIFYALDALHAERRDRSILFWKSLPVSDTTVVLAKAAVPIVFIPLFTTALTIVLYFAMLVLSTPVAWLSGMSAAALWQEVAPFTMSLVLVYHMLLGHVLWYAPVFAWVLLASAWARRAVFLWALLPPAAIAVVEHVAFGTRGFLQLLQNRAYGGPMFGGGPEEMGIDSTAHLTPGHFFSSPQMWAGLALTALFLFAAIRIRRHRGPI